MVAREGEKARILWDAERCVKPLFGQKKAQLDELR
jgi:hypothetical protein